MKKREPKIYTSFEELEKELYGSGVYRRSSGVGFSKDEVIHILAAVAVLTLSFAIATIHGSIWSNQPGFAGLFIFALEVSLLGISTGFLLHELAHKFTAQRFGLWAEFRASKWGLVLPLILSLAFGVVFAAPGAVYISGTSNKRENGLIGLAGPLTNIVIALFAFILSLSLAEIAPLLSIVFLYIFNINSFLAVFNMIPVPPLDGSKVLNWKPWVFGLVFGVSIALTLLSTMA